MSIISYQMPEKVTMEKADDFNGRFTFKPLEPGYGVTIGNALRRILLSSLEGYAITGIKITDVLHEFTTIEGVVEDVLRGINEEVFLSSWYQSEVLGNLKVNLILDREIKRLLKEGKLVIKPLSEDSITPNGVDLSVGDEAIVMLEAPEPAPTRVEVDEELVVPPYAHVLVVTEEYLELPPNIVGLVNLRSTYARRGLLIPPTVVDAGYKGRLTLALRGAPHPIKLRRGERVWHLVLVESYEAEKPYSGKYQGSTRLAPGF